ncbi:MAG: TetR/AcrR family transcriptional regulator [Myxococcota bacterium]
MTTRRRTRRRAPDDKRRRILDAARELFRAKGAGKVTTSQIAKKAGVSEGIIFHHFGSKRGVLAEVAGAYGHGVATRMFEGILPGQRPDVEGMVRRTCEYVADHGKLHDMLTMTEDPADWNAAIMASREIIIAALTQAFVQWRAAGYIETEHPAIAASLLYGLVESALTDCYVRGHEDRVEDYIAECVACIEGALGYEGPDPA